MLDKIKKLLINNLKLNLILGFLLLLLILFQFPIILSNLLEMFILLIIFLIAWLILTSLIAVIVLLIVNLIFYKESYGKLLTKLAIFISFILYLILIKIGFNFVRQRALIDNFSYSFFILINVVIILYLLYIIYKVSLIRLINNYKIVFAFLIFVIIASLYLVAPQSYSKIDSLDKNNFLNPNEKRVLMIGIDGATWDVIDPLIAEGKLPNLKKLKDGGAYGNIISTIPSSSPIAWTTLNSGVNQETHGIQGYASIDFPGENENQSFFRSNDKYDVNVKRIWDLAKEQNRRTVVLNMLITWPADSDEIDYLVTSYDAFGGYQTYPSDLNEQVGISKDKTPCVENFEARDCHTALQASYLINNVNWDLFVVLFDSTSVYQKYLGFAYHHEMFDVTREESLQYKNIIENNYKEIDKSIGELLKRIDDNTTVVVVSDHGYGREDIDAGNNLIGPTYFNVNRLLIRLGLLEIYPKEIRQGLSQKIVWHSTKAYFCNDVKNQVPGICINLKDREEYGIVNKEDFNSFTLDIKESLESIKFGNVKLLKNVKINKRKPDITFEFNSPLLTSYYIVKSRSFNSNVDVEVNGKTFKLRELFMYNALFSGDHEINGIFLFYNKNIKSGKASNLDIINMAPIILFSMDLEVPGYMDAFGIKNLYKEDYLSSNPVRFANISMDFKRERKELTISEEDNEAIRRSFLQLGYDV